MARTKEWRVPGPPRLRYSKAEVLALLDGLSESSLDALIADGRFPRGHKATPQSASYWSGQVLACYFLLGPMLVADPRRAKPDD